jgi:hypothetical protein
MANRIQRWHLIGAVLVMGSVGCAATAQDRAGPVAQGAAQARPVKMRIEPTARERIAMEAAFARADVNNDGKLSRAEAAHLPAIEARFDELDTDHDGFLSIDEFIAGAMTGAL